MAIQVYTAESVTEGHPDKICDQLSDRILDAILEQDKYARVACECLVTTGLVMVTGEITTEAYVDITGIVRQTLKQIGYTDPAISFDYQSCAVIAMFEEQSHELGLAVDRRGAGDQGIMVGYATDEGQPLGEWIELMPVPIMLANKLMQKLAAVRKQGIVPFLYPDGKCQLTLSYQDNQPAELEAVVVSTHHHQGVAQQQILADLQREVINPVLEPTGLLRNTTRILVNPTGSFIRGGPQVDVGLTGRKIAVDTYGSMARHGGSCLSGKDPTKTDRSAAYAARYIAKNIVATGLAHRCEVQLAYIVGVAEPISIAVDSFGSGAISDEKMVEMIRKEFDLTPAGIIETLDLRRPIYSPTAVYGHFGRSGENFPWERIDRQEDLARYR